MKYSAESVGNYDLRYQEEKTLVQKALNEGVLQEMQERDLLRENELEVVLPLYGLFDEESLDSLDISDALEISTSEVHKIRRYAVLRFSVALEESCDRFIDTRKVSGGLSS
jgi:DNA-directed RNA polymerase specialized sigma subunit